MKRENPLSFSVSAVEAQAFLINMLPLCKGKATKRRLERIVGNGGLKWFGRERVFKIEEDPSPQNPANNNEYRITICGESVKNPSPELQNALLRARSCYQAIYLSC
jgi:hypothetical protein